MHSNAISADTNFIIRTRKTSKLSSTSITVCEEADLHATLMSTDGISSVHRLSSSKSYGFGSRSSANKCYRCLGHVRRLPKRPSSWCAWPFKRYPSHLHSSTMSVSWFRFRDPYLLQPAEYVRPCAFETTHVITNELFPPSVPYASTQLCPALSPAKQRCWRGPYAPQRTHPSIARYPAVI